MKKNYQIRYANDGRLATIVQAVPIMNQDLILRETLKSGCENILKRYAEAIAEKRLIAAKTKGIYSLTNEEPNNEPNQVSSVGFEGRSHLVIVSPEQIAEPMNRSGFDKLIKRILKELIGSGEIGILQFLPYSVNSRSHLEYLKRELPCISFVDLKYNPKQVMQRAYELSRG